MTKTARYHVFRTKVAGILDARKAELLSSFGKGYLLTMRKFSPQQAETVARWGELDPASAIRQANGLAKKIQNPEMALTWAGAALAQGGRGRPTATFTEIVTLFIDKAIDLAATGAAFVPAKGYSFSSKESAVAFIQYVQKRTGGFLKGVPSVGRGRVPTYFVNFEVDNKLVYSAYKKMMG